MVDYKNPSHDRNSLEKTIGGSLVKDKKQVAFWMVRDSKLTITINETLSFSESLAKFKLSTLKFKPDGKVTHQSLEG